MSKLLEYTPEARLNAIESMIHPFFDELRVEGTRLQSGKDLPQLFNFTKEGESRLASQFSAVLTLVCQNRVVHPARAEPSTRPCMA